MHVTLAAKITVSNLGGFKVCEIVEAGKLIYRVKDINGLIWISKTEILYSVSPIYGKPGIFVFDCKLRRKKAIVKPANFNTAYPDGADYFELKEYLFSEKAFSYYYAVDIDLVDFKIFRNEKSLLLKRFE